MKIILKYKVLWILSLLPLLVTAASMPFMADKVGMHYNMAGEIDRYGSKYENFIFPVLIILFTLFWLILIYYFTVQEQKATDEKQQAEAKSNTKIIYFTANGMALLFGVMQYSFLFSNIAQSSSKARTMPIDIQSVINILIGIFIIAFGNYLPKVKRNSIIGIRTPWTMKSDENWRESNHFGAVLFIISGVLISLESILLHGIITSVISAGIIILAAIVVTIYSAIIDKRLSGNDTDKSNTP